MNVIEAIKDVASKNWIGLAILVLLYLQKLASSDSTFPWNPSPNVRNVIFTGLGLAGGVLAGVQGHLPATEIVLAGISAAVATGFLDGLLSVFFDHGAPGWARAITWLIKDIGGGGNAAPPVPPKAPPVAVVGVMILLAVSLAVIGSLATLTSGCTKAQGQEVKTIVDDASLACQAAEQQPEPAFVYVVCAVVDAAGNVIDTITAKVSKAKAGAFLAAHKPAPRAADGGQ